jgi:hypothetical protein
MERTEWKSACVVDASIRALNGDSAHIKEPYICSFRIMYLLYHNSHTGYVSWR